VSRNTMNLLNFLVGRDRIELSTRWLRVATVIWQ